MTRLYESLDDCARFVDSLTDSQVEDRELRQKAAIARFIAELSLSEYVTIREDWRSYVGVEPVG